MAKVSSNANGRGHWGSRIGFILAAAGSAVGLGNVWRFPYTAGENGGGLFVLFYLACVFMIGLPVMVSEIIIGRRAQKAPVPAFLELAPRGTAAAWSVVGWMGAAAGFLILSFYSVIAGWTMHYVTLAVSGAFADGNAAALLGEVAGKDASLGKSVGWHAVFMAITMVVVLGGVKKGIERASEILMPALFLLLVGLMVYGLTLDGAGEALSFLFSPETEKFKAAGALSALGQGLFSLSLGMGALLTYGSYLDRKSDLPGSAISISLLDTGVALMSGLILFPIIFSSEGLSPGSGPGLVFVTMPAAFGSMTGGYFLGIAFFVLLFFAALTSSISLLEVVAATIIDQLGWSRKKATLIVTGFVFLLGVPSAASQAGGMGFWEEALGMSFLDSVDYITANWFLPLGALFIAVFVGWVMDQKLVKEEFTTASKWAAFFPLWHFLIRFIVPVAIAIVFLVSIGVIDPEWFGGGK